ncbi:ArsR/SmtB family transcription factor [Helcococcus bovis]|uniref:ArsR/SmtB family transcription factor n=1 Tax=Helcococcus bovis TaxID=3153252 RepID=UPI0038B8BFC5
MNVVYTDLAKTLKALSDTKRLQIIDMLSCGELCACLILEAFHITQPTLPHHMKTLIKSGLVKDRKDGKNIFYSLNKSNFNKVSNNIKFLFNSKEICICNKVNKSLK